MICPGLYAEKFKTHQINRKVYFMNELKNFGMINSDDWKAGSADKLRVEN